MKRLRRGRAGACRLAGLLSLLALTVGCSSLQSPADGAPMIDIPAHWSMADAPGAGAQGVTAASLTDWWRRFGDPALNLCVQRALLGNTRVLTARAALAQAEAGRDVTAAALAPTLDAGASVQRGTRGGHSTGTAYQLGLSADWAPDVFGARRAALVAAEATARASAATLGDVQVQVATEVALAYVALRSAQNRLVVAQNTLLNQQDTLQITDWRQQAGLVTVLEVEQARTAAAQTQSALPALQTGITQGLHALALLAGAAPADDPGQDVLRAGAVMPTAADSLLLDIPAETLRQRADVRAAEFAVAAALAQVDEARAQRWPSFAIGGSLNLESLTLGALTHGASVVSSLLGSVSLPLFDGGGLRARVRVQQAALDQARQSHRAAVLGALRDVEDALIARQQDRLRLASLQQAADSADKAWSLARQRFSSGLVDFQTVLETQRTRFSTQDAVIGASADLANDHVRLFKALGGGWRDRPALAQAGIGP